VVTRVLNHASEIGKTITGALYVRHCRKAARAGGLGAAARDDYQQE
jgi:hypothetical protein